MPTITLNKTVLEKLIGKKLPLEQLKDRISMLGTDLEKIENNEIVVEVFPNRPDMLSEQGFARALSSFIGVKTGLRKYEVKKSGLQVIIDSSVQGIRPYTACAVVKNLTLNEEKIREIIQIQEKLHITYGRNRRKCALGIYPLEKIVFPITYKADFPGNIKFQPLDMGKKMNASHILEQHKAGKEYGHLLTGMKKYPFFADAKGDILSMPPIINSETTGKITARTKEMFIECSGFDFSTLSICLNIMVTALAEMGGEIFSMELMYEKEKKVTPVLEPSKMRLDLKYVNSRLGLNLLEKDAKKLLERMGYNYQSGNVLVPAYRADILHQVDIMEDIAISYGYENFVPEIPNVATIGQEDALENFWGKAREILIGSGLLEVKNYHLITEEELNQKMLLHNKIIPLKNSVGEYNHLRNSLLPSLLKNLQENQHREYPKNIFEIGTAFEFEKNETGVAEKQKLGIILCHEKVDFTEVRQMLDVFMKALGVECKVKESKHPSFIDGRVAEILIKRTKVGIIGEFHPQVLVNWGIMMPVVSLELDLEKLFELVR